jgi:hypothetical protein
MRRRLVGWPQGRTSVPSQEKGRSWVERFARKRVDALGRKAASPGVGLGGSGGYVPPTCGATITFSAADADHYRVTTVDTDRGCGATVSRPDPSSPSGWSEVPYITRTRSTPFIDNSGPWCKGDATFRGSSVLLAPRGP